MQLDLGTVRAALFISGQQGASLMQRLKTDDADRLQANYGMVVLFGLEDFLSQIVCSSSNDFTSTILGSGSSITDVYTRLSRQSEI